jgi:ubiquinone/menaquinone biosynthesis C-methylase UbiE
VYNVAFQEHWEIEHATNAEIWPLMIGKDTEDSAETELQIAMILNSVPVIPAGHRALELGAGVGRLVRAISPTGRFSEVCGVDSSMSIVLASQEYLRDHPAVTVHLGDGVNLPFPDNHFDFVYSFTAFQHMISLAIIHRNLREIRRVLVPGGLCRIQTINSNGDDPRDLKTYDGRVFRSVEEFAEQFQDAGLEVIGTAEGLTHPKHIYITARKRSQ